MIAEDVGSIATMRPVYRLTVIAGPQFPEIIDFSSHCTIRGDHPADNHRLARIHSSVTPALQHIR